MSEPCNRAAYDAFLTGLHHYSLLSKEKLDSNQDRTDLAIKIDPNCARAWSLSSFNLVQGWLYGYSDESVLPRAEDAAIRAVQLDPGDYFTHAYLGFYYLRTGRFALALTAYETALALNDDDRLVISDAAEAYIYSGDVDTGITMLNRARRIPDQQRWNLAWAYYFKGRTDSSYYGMALAELDQLFYKRGADKYIFDIDLLFAAIHAQKGDASLASDSIAAYRARISKDPHRSTWSVADEASSEMFSDPVQKEHWLDGLRKAGLRETPKDTDRP